MMMLDPPSTRRDSDWSRLRLALRLAAPVERAGRWAARKVAGSAALAAIPITVFFAAPVSALGPGTIAGLFCVALPGVVATGWTVAAMRGDRQASEGALLQAGAEQRTAWMLSACRPALFAGAGALGGGLFVTALHAPLATVLPSGSPLLAAFASRPIVWLAASASATLPAMAGALLADSPIWSRGDRPRIRAPKASRPPR
jgi:hypothetical protein